MKHLAITLLTILVLSLATTAQFSVKLGSNAPAFAAASLDGKRYELEALRGKVVVLTFWSTRCAICHSEMPKLNGMADRFAGENVELLAMSTENASKISSYLRSNPFKFRIVPDSFAWVLQYADRDRQGNLDMGYPAYFVIDQSGVVRHRSSGYDKTEQMSAAIARLIGR